MEQVPQFVIMTRDEILFMITEVTDRVLNQGNIPYHSWAEGSTTKVFTRNEIASILKKSPNTITKYIKQKKLHAKSLNGQYIICEKELINFINTQKNTKC